MPLPAPVIQMVLPSSLPMVTIPSRFSLGEHYRRNRERPSPDMTPVLLISIFSQDFEPL